MTITPEQFLAELRTIAEKAQAELGGKDYVYTNPHGANGSGVACFYVHCDEEGQPVAGCIIGKWLHQDHGVSFGALRSQETIGASATLAAFGLAPRSTVHSGPGVVQRIADRVQSHQDHGTGWLRAVEKVEHEYEIGLFK